MTPAARVQAAIEILDQYLSGTPAEQALTGWARRSRFAGSKDRAAVRDHVFGALRCKRSFAALGGALTGRGLMLGALCATGEDADALFTGVGHAPQPLAPAELAAGHAPEPGPEACDIPDWLWPVWCDGLGDKAEQAAHALQSRAPVHLRVNLRKATREQAQAALTEEGIETAPHPAAASALEVSQGARRIRQSSAYMSGVVELQDAASQAVVEALPLRDGMRVLDYCAGGGGKTLAMAARADICLFAHDAAPRRMADLPARAKRAGVRVTTLTTRELASQAPFDLILCDVPCSGSGAWRRSPEGKWALTPEQLAGLNATQDQILREASALVGPAGVLAYATCSVLADENRDRIQTFCEDVSGWQCGSMQSWSPAGGTDGFFAAHLTSYENVGLDLRNHG